MQSRDRRRQHFKQRFLDKGRTRIGMARQSWIDVVQERFREHQTLTAPRGPLRWQEANRDRLHAQSDLPSTTAESLTRGTTATTSAGGGTSSSSQLPATGSSSQRPAAGGSSQRPAAGSGTLQETIAQDLAVTASGFEPQRYSLVIEGRPVQVTSSIVMYGDVHTANVT